MRKLPCPYTDPVPLFRHGGAAVRDGKPLLDFSVSVNPLGPPQTVLKVLRQDLHAVARYPDPECQKLTAQLEALHAVEPNQIVVGNGSNELIYAIARACRPKRVAIAEPTYTEYLRASLLVGAEVDHWLAEGDTFELQPFNAEEADLVWLCNPNNPTGQLWAAQDLASWIKSQASSLFVVDEAFLPFLRYEAERSLIPATGALTNLIVLRSLTKVFGLPGLRLGYAVSNAALAERIRAQLVPWSVNALAQIAGLAALRDRDFMRETHAWLETERLFLRNLDPLRNLEVMPSHSNFILLRLRGVTSGWLRQKLQSNGIEIRDASNFVGLDSRFVRVAVRTASDNVILLDQIWSFLATATEMFGVEEE